VGVAVADLDSAIELYKTSFGARFKGRVADKESGLDVAFLEMGDVEIELLASLREDSTIGKFLAKRGPGLHHLAYAVPDVRRALADARGAGLELIDAEPRIGLHGVPIAFIHPTSVGGVLTELVEHG
jgi:methylmalonyl-CoA/ethylmalonyl-CoA epimerase